MPNNSTQNQYNMIHRSLERYATHTPGLVINLDARDNPAGAITSWVDRQNGYNFTGTATRDSAINGWPSVTGNGTTDILSSTADIAQLSGSTAVTIFIIAKCPFVVNGGEAIIEYGANGITSTASEAGSFAIYTANTGTTGSILSAVCGNVAPTRYRTSSSVGPNEPAVWSFLSDFALPTAETATIRKNGYDSPITLVTAADNSGSMGSLKLNLFSRVGGALRSGASISKLLVFNRALTSAEMEPIERMLGELTALNAVNVKGTQGFLSPTNYYATDAGVFLPGSATGFYVSLAYYQIAAPNASVHVYISGAASSRGFSLRTSAASWIFSCMDGAGVNKFTPFFAPGAAANGTVLLITAVYDANTGTLRIYRAGVEVGVGTAIAGYTEPLAGVDSAHLGAAAGSAATWARIVGATYGTGSPTPANILAHYNACKEQGDMALMGGTGVTNVNRWRASQYLPAATSWPDDINGMVLTKTGTLSTVVFYPVWE